MKAGVVLVMQLEGDNGEKLRLKTEIKKHYQNGRKSG